ncbi:MAG: hypothetical protein OHK93_001101 [Ramalina farinacea]|uniref:Uncharacterized protein n=1 Tax=Ramalina farinacea TaxID=258253 RepID=A0AA43TZ64_9LECA|nr:hypothetical protein [Ramalina farinacea]
MAVGDSPESLQEEKVLRQQKAKLKTLREDGRAMQEQIDKTIELRNAKEAKAAMLQEDIKKAQLAIEEQQKALDDKRDVKRPLEEAIKAVREDEAKLARLQKKLQNLQATIDGKEKLLSESEVVLADLNEQEAALTVKEAGLLEHQKKTEELQKKIEKENEKTKEQIRLMDQRKAEIDTKLNSELEFKEEQVHSLNGALEIEGRNIRPHSDTTDQDKSLTRGMLEEASVEIAKFADEARRQIEDTRRLANAKHQESQAELAKFTDELRQQLEDSRQLLSQTDLDWMNFWKKLKRDSDSEVKELEADWRKLEKVEPGLVLKFVKFLRRENEKDEGGSKLGASTNAAPVSDLHAFLTEFEARVLSLYKDHGLEYNSTLPRKMFVNATLLVMFEKGRALEAELGIGSKKSTEIPVDSSQRGLKGSGQKYAENDEPSHNSIYLADILANGSISELKEEARRLKAQTETDAKASQNLLANPLEQKLEEDTQDPGADIDQETTSGSQPKRRGVFHRLDRALLYWGLIVLFYQLVTAYRSHVMACVMNGDCF